MSQQKILDVAVAIIKNSEGQVLINEHLDPSHYGHWEFPGGKFETGESPIEALVRECREEIGINVTKSNALITFSYQYPNKTVRLHVFEVIEYKGLVQALENQKINWVLPENLDQQNMLPADVTIVKALCLPRYLMVTPSIVSQEKLEAAVNKTYKNYIRLCAKHNGLILQLRQHTLSSEQYIHYAQSIIDLTDQYIDANSTVNSKFIIQLNTSLKVFKKIDKPRSEYLQVGLHLTSKRLNKFNRKKLINNKIRVGASVHNKSELQLAIDKQCDYIIIGMLKPSMTHPNKIALGWDGMSTLLEDKSIISYAIGGLQLDDLDTAKHHGAFGIAGITMFKSKV